jgi:hypothetical protein
MYFRRYVLLKHHKIYLTVESMTDKPNVAQFIKLFKMTWKRIPSSEIAIILKYWRANILKLSLKDQRKAGPKVSARISRYPRSGICYTDQNDSIIKRNAIGAEIDEGHGLVFWWPAIDLLPDDIVCFLIAHELAHVRELADNPKHKTLSNLAADVDADALVSEDWCFEEPPEQTGYDYMRANKIPFPKYYHKGLKCG